jgi:hypothetical protein
VLRHVGGLELSRSAGEDPGDVEGDVADPHDDDRPHPRQRRLDLRAVGVGMAGVPGDQVGGREAAGELLALDPQAAVQ